MAAASQNSSWKDFISGSKKAKVKAEPREKQIISLLTHLKPVSSDSVARCQIKSEIKTEEISDGAYSESRSRCLVNEEHAEPHLGVQEAPLNGDDSPDTRGVLCMVNRQNPKCTKAKRTTTSRKRTVDQARVCTLCGRSFTRLHHLKIHMRIHTGEKPYKCTECQKCFARSGELDVHKRFHRGEKPYGCGVCAKRFSSSTHLKVHERTHTGTKPHACDHCEKSFTHAGDLVKHRRIHTGDRPYPCVECGMAFRRTGTLKKHQKRHMRAKSFTCVYCDKILCFEAGLQKHMKFNCKKLKKV